MENCTKKIINGREYITTEEKVIIRGKEITVVNNRPIKSQEEENDKPLYSDVPDENQRSEYGA